MSTEDTNIVPVNATLQAEAASAHSRINIPLNLDNWRQLDTETQGELLWLHQWILDNRVGWKDSEEALGYDKSTIFRVLKGTYAGSWDKIVESIRSFRRLQEQRATIQSTEFVPNGITRLVWAGLDYAMANNSITTIIGESRFGKTIASTSWAMANNHGRSVYVVAPPIGGVKGLLRAIAAKIGSNKNASVIQLVESIHRAFNKHRILIIDEAHRLMPNDTRTNPALLEFLRDLHDQTGCALALIATARFDDRLRGGTYQFEQLIGRIGMPIRLPKQIKPEDIRPIVTQFLPEASPALVTDLLAVANRAGRLGIMTETLKVASRIAAKAKELLTETHVRKALALRHQMSGNH